MFGKTSQGDLNGFLDAGSHIQGELRFEDTFRVDGRVEGGVVSDGVLIVGDRGEIDGEIRVRRIFVSGVLRGRVDAEEYLEITSNGRVFADLEVANLKIEEGAVFEGRCSMKTSAKDSKRAEKQDDATPSNVTRLPQRSGDTKVS
ncbi:MAG: polymer-forming cytoskeletal protein [Thermoanaerobaculia bacterium]|nr:polymer-forming cytoskeletal protein [Thermoanaerobaculia bacterium]